MPQLAESYAVVGRRQGADDEGAQRASRSTTARSSTRRRSSSTSSGTRRCRAATGAASWRSCRTRRRRRPDDRAAQPVAAVLAAARAARRPRRHDGVAEGRAGRGRQVRRQPGVLRPVQVRRARRAGPHRARALRRLLEQGRRSTSTAIVYLPIVDATVRLANLKSGQLDFIERMAASDVEALKNDSRFKIQTVTEIGYQGITINVGKSDLAKTTALGKDAARARGVRARARPRRHRAGRDGRPGDGRQPVGRAGQPVLREEHADPEARRREGEGAARRRRRAQPVGRR